MQVTTAIMSPSTTQQDSGSESYRAHSVGVTLLSCGTLFSLLCLRNLLVQYQQIHRVAFVDDAYYYFVVARHLVYNGQSTFDGFTLTNGYHPLWMALLALQYKFLGDSQLLTRAIEFLLGLGALLTTLPVVRLPGIWLNLLFTAGLFSIFSRISFNGMETALFACSFGLFTLLCDRRLNSQPEGGAAISGLFAAATIAARIDAFVFVIPALFLAAASWRRKAVAVAVTLCCGLFYAAVNYHIFGLALPVSGEVKSLGGLQFNHALFHQLANLHAASTQLFYLTLVLLLISLARRQTRSLLPKARVLAFAIGLLVYCARLSFFSSWQIWSWYDYPLFVCYVACFPALLLDAQNIFRRLFSSRQRRIATISVISLVVVFYSRAIVHARSAGTVDVYPINQGAINEYGPILGGARVAMGDRAGNFAFVYTGGINQLEGLMNDRAYLEVLRKKGDVKALLCQRDVRFVLSYEADLGDYQTHEVETIRKTLSQFPAPRIEVERQDEVGRFGDLAKFDARVFGDDDSYLYIWRLRCT
jgi:hypothetical protein